MLVWYSSEQGSHADGSTFGPSHVIVHPYTYSLIQASKIHILVDFLSEASTNTTPLLFMFRIISSIRSVLQSYVHSMTVLFKVPPQNHFLLERMPSST